MEKAEVNHKSDSYLLGSLPSFLNTSQVIEQDGFLIWLLAEILSHLILGIELTTSGKVGIAFNH